MPARQTVVRRAVAALALAAAALAGAAPAQAASPAGTFVFHPAFQTVDFDNGLILFVNSTRADFCTEDMVAAEEAFLEWLAGGEVGEPPEFPEYEGMAAVEATRMPVGQHNSWAKWSSTVPVELWTFDTGVFPDAIGVGPCTDSDEEGALFATGTGTWTGSDNDFWDDPSQAGPRTNAIKDTIKASRLVGPGGDYGYTAVFHNVIRNPESDDFRFVHGGFRAVLEKL